MADQHPGTPPKGALPMLEAIRRFVSQDLWKDYNYAMEVLNQMMPRRGIRLSTHLQGLPAEQSINFPTRLHSALARVNEALRKITDRLIERLIAGDLTAVVQVDVLFGEWRPSPANLWEHLQIEDVKCGHVIGRNIDWTDVRIIEGDHTRLLEPMKTGVQGRQSSKHLVLAELDRWIVSGDLAHWIASGQVDDTLKAVADGLVKWLEQTYPKAPPLTQTSMENVIRSKVNKFKKDCKPV